MMAKDSQGNCNCCYKVWIGWIRFCRAINDFIELLFEHHTRFVTKHYKLVIVLCFVFTGIMGIGGVRFKALMRNEELFIPQGSQAFEDLEKGEQYFPLKHRFEEFIIKRSDGRDIFMSNDLLLEALTLHQKVIALPNFNQTCSKIKNTTQCLFVSVLGAFNYNKTLIKTLNNTTVLTTYISSFYNDSTQLLSNGRHGRLNFPNILGQFQVHPLTSNALRMTYYMRYADTTDNEYDSILDWEKEFIDLCEKQVDILKNKNLELFYFTARTRDDAILLSTIGDLPLFSVAFILMVLFCLFVFFRYDDPVVGHLTLGIAGICVIMLGVGCGFGLAMLCGVDFVAFTGILMFLILGIGMDNMFIIIDATESVDPDIQGPERLVVAMKHVGGSITMTTSTDLVAFAVSTVSNFPAIHLFCVYAALSIFFAYAMLITLFLALVTADIHRVESGKRDVCPCCKAKAFDKNINPWKQTKEKFSKKMLGKWGELLMTRPMKIIVVIIAMGLLAAGIYGTTQITQKFDWKKTGRDGSYFLNFVEARDDNFPSGYGVSVILPPGVDYTKEATQKNILDLNQIAYDNKRFDNQAINWLEGYYHWDCQRRNENISACILKFNLTGNNFYAHLDEFLTANPVFKADINQVTQNKTILSSRVIFFYENNKDATNQAEAMKTIRKDLKEKSELARIFPISIMFIYSEMFAAVVNDTIKNLAICACAILVITLPYLIHPGITALVFLSFTSLLFELLGLMTAWDTSLDVIAMIIIIMAIGFSVDYTCHIAHAFMISKKTTPEERAIDALVTMGTSVLNGGVSTFLGMLITAASKAEGFRIFFRMVFGIVVLGLLHGLVFLPVFLSIFVRRDLRQDMKELLEERNTKGEERKEHRLSKMKREEKQESTTSDNSANNNIGKENEVYYIAKPLSNGNVALAGVTKNDGTDNASFQ